MEKFIYNVTGSKTVQRANVYVLMWMKTASDCFKRKMVCLACIVGS